MRIRRVVGTVAALTLVAGVTPVTGAAQDSGRPSLSLRRTATRTSAYVVGKRAPRLFAPVFLQVVDAPLDLRVRRASYGHPRTISQVLHGPGGNEIVELPAEALDGWRGLADFTRIKVRSLRGRVLYSTTAGFCPNRWERQRVNDAGPATPTFPSACYRGRFLRGMAWGIDEGWATRIVGNRGVKLDVDPGRYVLTISITRRFRELFGIDASAASTTLDLRVGRLRRRHCCHEGARSGAETQSGTDAAPAGVPMIQDPDPATLPDLEALPAFGMRVRNLRNGRSRLWFASMVWVGGASSLVVEGFRRPEEDVMDAYQYFYDRDEAIGRAPVGTLEYDRRDGHFHWHFQQFAAYRMVDPENNEVVRSTKQSFCLAPTDPVDLSLDNASWDTERTGLHTACGGPEALWIREVLPLGWGDTYHQVGGQSFNITNLPNGAYFVEVQANPGGLLHEQDSSNNSVLRKVILRGTRGNRRVRVRPWFGIDF